MNKMKNLIGKLYEPFRRKLYAPLAALALSIPSYALSQETRTTETETFATNTTSKALNEEYPEKINIVNERIEMQDFDPQWGDEKKWDYNRVHFVDKLYDLQGKNMSISMDIIKDKWGSDVDYIYFVFGGDPTNPNQDNGTYYAMGINRYFKEKIKYHLARLSPGYSEVFFNGEITLTSEGEMNNLVTKLSVANNAKGAEFTDINGFVLLPGYNIFINNKKVNSTIETTDWDKCKNDPNLCPINPINCTKLEDGNYSCDRSCDIWVNCPKVICNADPDTGNVLPETCEPVDVALCKIDYERCPKITINYTGNIPQNLNAYIGGMIWDSMGRNDPEFSSTTSFDNFIVIKDAPAGAGGAVGRIIRNGLEKKLIPHKPEIFLRGDTNRDKTFNIADVIATLEYLFVDQNKYTCLDAMDIDDNGTIDLTDPIKGLFYIFRRGSLVIPNPHNGGEGIDMLKDNLNCPNE